MPERADVAAVVLAAGSGTRLAAADGQNKVYIEVGGRPLLSWSIATLDAHPRIGSLVVVVRDGDQDQLRLLFDRLQLSRPVAVVTGGATRSASERAAFAMLRPAVEAGEVRLVLVHDGARPFVSPGLIDRVAVAAARHGGAIPGLEPDRAVFEVDPDGSEAHRLDASRLRRVQTPQGFAAGPLLDAYDQADAAGVDGVDTAEVVARFVGLDAVVVEGDPDNIKVTTPDDLAAALEIAARISRGGR
jgi:2-C-methyl-D-erythritol 4-phosphate cytidylyltransferase